MIPRGFGSIQVKKKPDVLFRKPLTLKMELNPNTFYQFKSIKFYQLKKTKDTQAAHSSCHESFIHLDTVGPGLGDKCIFKRKAAKMLCWNFAPWIFCEGRQQPHLQLECCRGSLWRNTDMNPPQELVRSPRQQPQPGCFFASPLPEAPEQWNSWVGEKWETMWWQAPVRRNRGATFEHSGEGVVPWVHVLVLHPDDVESTLAGMHPAGNVWGKLIIKTLCKHHKSSQFLMSYCWILCTKERKWRSLRWTKNFQI